MGETGVVFDPTVRRNRCAECRRVVASGQRDCLCGATLAQGAADRRSSVSASN